MSDKQRRPYDRPEMERVRLVPDEAVLGGCKISSGGGVGTEIPAGNCQTVTPACVTNATS